MAEEPTNCSLCVEYGDQEVISDSVNIPKEDWRWSV